MIVARGKQNVSTMVEWARGNRDAHPEDALGRATAGIGGPREDPLQGRRVRPALARTLRENARQLGARGRRAAQMNTHRQRGGGLHGHRAVRGVSGVLD